MINNTFSPSVDWKTVQRRKAVELYEKGYKQTQIAEILNVTQSSISLWIKKANNGGLEALQTKYSPGAPTKLDAEQKKELIQILRQEPTIFGFPNKLWSRKQIAEIIRIRFNVIYDLSQISRILKKFSFTEKVN